MPDDVAVLREFNRFYTNQIGVLRSGLLDSPYTLTEARVLFELAQRVGQVGVADLRRALDIDAGYLSRILARFTSDGLITRGRAADDARRQVIALTDNGRSAFRVLDERSADAARRLLDRLATDERRRLLAAMGTIRGVLDSAPARPRGYLIRPPAAGELGWIVQRHGELYAEEHGWDETFEALVAKIVGEYAAARDPAREAAWIAELDGAPAGCVMCVRRDEQTAQLRLLLVEPSARGLGIGARLVDECLRFAKAAGYRRIVLWTQDVLAQALRIYQRAGFELEEQGQHRSFGHELVEQTWARAL